MSKIVPLLFFYKDDFGIYLAMRVVLPKKKIKLYNQRGYKKNKIGDFSRGSLEGSILKYCNTKG